MINNYGCVSDNASNVPLPDVPSPGPEPISAMLDMADNLTLKALAMARLEFFREQLTSAERSLAWLVSHSQNWENCAEKGEIVSYYRDVVEMLEEK